MKIWQRGGGLEVWYQKQFSLPLCPDGVEVLDFGELTSYMPSGPLAVAWSCRCKRQRGTRLWWRQWTHFLWWLKSLKSFKIFSVKPFQEWLRYIEFPELLKKEWSLLCFLQDGCCVGGETHYSCVIDKLDDFNGALCCGAVFGIKEV